MSDTTTTPTTTRQVPLSEAARLLKVSRRTVERRLSTGTLEGRKEGGQWLVVVPCAPPDVPQPMTDPTTPIRQDAGIGGTLIGLQIVRASEREATDTVSVWGSSPASIVPGSQRSGPIRLALIGVVVLALVAPIVLLWAAADYAWAPTVVQREEQNGWMLAATLDNYIDPTHPWMIVSQPVTGVWFVNVKTARWVDSNRVTFNELHVRWHAGGEERNTGRNVVDCKTKTMTFVDEKTEVTAPSLLQIDWHSYEVGMPGAQIIDFACR